MHKCFRLPKDSKYVCVGLNVIVFLLYPNTSHLNKFQIFVCMLLFLSNAAPADKQVPWLEIIQKYQLSYNMKSLEHHLHFISTIAIIIMIGENVNLIRSLV